MHSPIEISALYARPEMPGLDPTDQRLHTVKKDEAMMTKDQLPIWAVTIWHIQPSMEWAIVRS